MAAATVAAGTAAQVFLGGNAPEFERLGDVFLDGFLYLVQRFLRIQEAARDRIAQQSLAILFKIADLLSAERQGALLFVVQRLAFRHQGFILGPGLVVRHKRVNALADVPKVWLGHDRAAQFEGLFRDGVFYSRCCHKFWLGRTMFSVGSIEHKAPAKAIEVCRRPFSQGAGNLRQDDQGHSSEQPITKNPKRRFLERHSAESGKADRQNRRRPKMEDVQRVQ